MRKVLLLSVVATCAATSTSQAQDPAGPEIFAPPVRVQAGDELLGAGRSYPSPAWHDVDGDGLLDIVVGDLRGRITWAPRRSRDELAFGAEIALKTADGQDIDFHNW